MCLCLDQKRLIRFQNVSCFEYLR